MNNKKYIIGLFDDEEVMLPAVKAIREKGLMIYDVLTPFPVHGLEHALGYRDSRLHTFGFIVGTVGLITALSFMTWINVSDYPINFGGKPFFSLPSYIPIVFEATVLTSSVAMVIAFFARSGLFPGKKPRIFDERITDHLFAMVFEIDASASEKEITEIHEALNQNGVVEVKEKDFDDED